LHTGGLKSPLSYKVAGLGANQRRVLAVVVVVVRPLVERVPPVDNYERRGCPVRVCRAIFGGRAARPRRAFCGPLPHSRFTERGPG